MKLAPINPKLHIILIEVPISYDNILAKLEELFLLRENSGWWSPMDNPVHNGHEGLYELRVPANARYSSYKYILVKDGIPLFVGRNHIKAQTFKLFDVCIH